MNHEEKMEGYFLGFVHAELISIRDDLRMGDSKSALNKAESALKMMDDKMEDVMNEWRKNIETP